MTKEQGYPLNDPGAKLGHRHKPGPGTIPANRVQGRH